MANIYYLVSKLTSKRDLACIYCSVSLSFFVIPFRNWRHRKVSNCLKVFHIGSKKNQDSVQSNLIPTSKCLITHNNICLKFLLCYTYLSNLDFK